MAEKWISESLYMRYILKVSVRKVQPASAAEAAASVAAEQCPAGCGFSASHTGPVPSQVCGGVGRAYLL